MWLCSNAIDCEFSCKLCYWKSFVEKGLSRNVNDCRFVKTNFISTKMKIRFQPMEVNRSYCLSFDDFASLRADDGYIGVTNVMRLY